MTPHYPVTIGEITFQAAPLPLEVRELAALGATIGCPVNAMTRRQDAPINFGHTLEHEPEFFTFWCDEIAEAEWQRAVGFGATYQYRYVSSLNPNRGLITKAIWFLLPARVDPLAACHAVLREALISPDPTKLIALLQPRPP